jgi:hypothetical protein
MSLIKYDRVKNLPHAGDAIEKEGNISIFQQDWFETVLPETIKLVSSPNLVKLNFDQSLTPIQGREYTFYKNDCTIDFDIVQFNYYNVTDHKPGEELNDGEPSFVEFDIHFLKNVDGIKLIVDITYGDNSAVSFSIESPNKINISHYTGVGSKHDTGTHWGFKQETIRDLVKFFNSFNHGIKISEKDLAFMDEHLDSYQHNTNDSKHLYNDSSDLVKFGNSPSESKLTHLQTFESFSKKNRSIFW